MILGYKRSLSNLYATKLNNNGYLLFKDFFNSYEASKIKCFSNNLDYFKEDKLKATNNQYQLIENFIKNDDNIKNLLEEKINPLINNICKEKMILSEDKIYIKKPYGAEINFINQNCKWNLSNKKYVNICLFGNIFTKKNGGYLEIDNRNKKENINIIETTPKDLLIFNSYIPYKFKNNRNNYNQKIFHFTFTPFSIS
mgnify:CR=1 FL=1|tara:strand:- start:30 stop:623 length:594 start_codon:yes stop_codon:yes gene_type:complete